MFHIFYQAHIFTLFHMIFFSEWLNRYLNFIPFSDSKVINFNIMHFQFELGYLKIRGNPCWNPKCRFCIQPPYAFIFEIHRMRFYYKYRETRINNFIYITFSSNFIFEESVRFSKFSKILCHLVINSSCEFS